MGKRIVRTIENKVGSLGDSFYGFGNFDKFITRAGGKYVASKFAAGFGYYIYHMQQQGVTLHHEVRPYRNEKGYPTNTKAIAETIMEGKEEACTEIERKILAAEKVHKTGRVVLI